MLIKLFISFFKVSLLLWRRLSFLRPNSTRSGLLWGYLPGLGTGGVKHYALFT